MAHRPPLILTSLDRTQRSFFGYIFDEEYGHFKMKWPIKFETHEEKIPFRYPFWLVDRVSMFDFVENEKDRLQIFMHYDLFAIKTDYSCIEPIPNGHLHFLISFNIISQHVSSIKLLRWNVLKQEFELKKKWPR